MSTTGTTDTTARWNANILRPFVVVQLKEHVQPHKPPIDTILQPAVVPVVRVVRSFTCGT